MFVLLFGGWLNAEARPKRPPPRPEKAVSSPAYYHALRAELALSRQDPEQAANELRLALVYDETSARLALMLARLELNAGRTARAQKLVEQVKSREPKHPEVWLLLGELALARASESEAIRFLERALELDPGQVRALNLLLPRLGPAEQAKLLRRLAERDPQAVEPLVRLAGLEASAQRWDSAVEALLRALKRSPDPQVLVLLAQMQWRQDRMELALPLLLQFLEIKPDEPEILRWAAYGALWLGQPENAARHLGRLMRVARERATESIAETYADAGYFVEADRAYASLPRLSPAARLGWARARLALLDPAAASAQLEPIGPGAAQYEEARVLLVRTLLRQGRWERAEAALARSEGRWPRLEGLEAELALRRGRIEDAKAMLPSLGQAEASRLRLLLEPNWPEAPPDGVSWLIYAQMALSRGRPELAKQVLSRCADLRADERCRSNGTASVADSQLLMGEAEVALGRWAEAKKSLEAARALSPRAARVWLALGQAHAGLGESDQAARALARAQRLVVDEGVVLARIGDVYMKLGRQTEAKAAYERAKVHLAGAVKAKETGAEAAWAQVRGL